MNQRVVILVVGLIIATGVAIWYLPVNLSQPDDSPSTPIVEENYPPLTEVSGSEIILRGSEDQIQVRYVSEILYCTVRDQSSGDELEQKQQIEPNETWDYSPTEVSITCQPTGDGFVEGFPQQQEYYVPIE